jgi:hypothetical protein
MLSTYKILPTSIVLTSSLPASIPYLQVLAESLKTKVDRKMGKWFKGAGLEKQLALQ